MIHIERHMDSNGNYLDIAFSEQEYRLPYEYRYQKRLIEYERHGFDYKNSCVIREWQI